MVNNAQTLKKWVHALPSRRYELMEMIKWLKCLIPGEFMIVSLSASAYFCPRNKNVKNHDFHPEHQQE